MGKPISIVSIFLLFLFFWQTSVVNRTEAEDAYDYALQIETGDARGHFHPHHLLFGPMGAAAYRLAEVCGYEGRAHGFMVMVSAAAASLVVFLFFTLCRKRLALDNFTSFGASGMLAFSYGFWRYAGECEIIMPAGLLALLAVYVATAPAKAVTGPVLAGAIAGCGVLIHILNGISAFVALPLLYGLRREFRNAACCVAVAAAIVAVPYGVVYGAAGNLVPVPFLPSAGDGNIGPANLLKGVIGFGQCIASGNFLFGFEAFTDRMLALFPTRMLAEEIFLGHHISAATRRLAAATAMGGFLAFATLFLTAARHWWSAVRSREFSHLVVVSHWRLFAPIAIWFAAYAAVILLMEPGNPEVWVMGLPPFWLMFAGCILDPVRIRRRWLIPAALGLLAIHNTIGGIAILGDPSTDYNRHKSAWVIENTDPRDLVITAGNAVFVRYLRYHSPTPVIDVNEASLPEVASAIRRADQVFLLNDLFDYPAPLRARFPAAGQRVDAFAESVHGRALRVHDDPFGGVWVLRDDP